MDDEMSGWLVENNTFVDCQTAMLLGGGRDAASRALASAARRASSERGSHSSPFLRAGWVSAAVDMALRAVAKVRRNDRRRRLLLVRMNGAREVLPRSTSPARQTVACQI